MLNVLGENYYIDLDEIENYLDMNDPVVSDSSQYDEFSGGTETKINIIKFEMVKLLLETILSERDEIDDNLGLKKSDTASKASIPFKLAFNSLLNKISPKNYNNIIKQIVVHFNENKDLINDLLKPIIDNIFLKAVSQPIYCPLYVRFIKLIDSKFTITLLLKNKCLDYKKILEVQDKQNSKENLSEQELYDKFCEENSNKIFKTGYSQFIGELYNNHLIKEDVITDNIRGFINNFKIIIVKEEKDINIIESIIICLSKLLITTYNNIKIRNFSIKDMYFHRECLSKRLQFKIEDINEFVNKK